MKYITTLLAALVICLGLTGCQQMRPPHIGAFTPSAHHHGTTTGGEKVASESTTSGPTLTGAYLGGEVGRSMDSTDRRQVSSALENNAAGQPAFWRNQKSGSSYQVVPTKNVTVRGNEYCREYRTTAEVGGKKTEVYGTACRKGDGSWKVVG